MRKPTEKKKLLLLCRRCPIQEEPKLPITLQPYHNQDGTSFSSVVDQSHIHILHSQAKQEIQRTTHKTLHLSHRFTTPTLNSTADLPNYMLKQNCCSTDCWHSSHHLRLRLLSLCFVFSLLASNYYLFCRSCCIQSKNRFTYHHSSRQPNGPANDCCCKHYLTN